VVLVVEEQTTHQQQAPELELRIKVIQVELLRHITQHQEQALVEVVVQALQDHQHQEQLPLVVPVVLDCSHLFLVKQ
jgi:hypothetical protein